MACQPRMDKAKSSTRTINKGELYSFPEAPADRHDRCAKFYSGRNTHSVMGAIFHTSGMPFFPHLTPTLNLLKQFFTFIDKIPARGYEESEVKGGILCLYFSEKV